MTAQQKSGMTRKLKRGAHRAGRTPSDALGLEPASTLVGTVLQLQRTAGNQAVARAMTSARSSTAHPSLFPLQRQPAGTNRNDSAGAQLAAVWDAQVVVPLARAADRLGRAEADPKGAKADIETALRTISTIRTATRGDDPNGGRLQVTERRTRGVLDLVDQRLGGGKNGDQIIINDMIKVRSEAATLGPLVEHWPEVAQPDSGSDAEPAQEPGTQTPEPGQGTAQAPAPRLPAEAPVETAPATAATPSEAASLGAAGESIADLWKFVVIDRLWSGQQAFGHGDSHKAMYDYNMATLRILQFQDAPPEGHPNLLRLLNLAAGVESIGDLMTERDREFGGDPLVDRAFAAYETAVLMAGNFGGPESSSTSETPAGAQRPGSLSEDSSTTEPDFTWERERPPFKDDTALERP